MYIVEVKDGRWRSVRYAEPMDDIDEANTLMGWLVKWNLGVFRVTEVK